MPVLAVSFDFWNTLFAEQPGGFQFYKESRLNLLLDAVGEIGGLSRARLAEACRIEARHHDRIWREQHRTLPVGVRLERIMSEIGVNLPADSSGELVAAFEEGVLMRPPVLIDGAREMIDRLAGHYRVGLISDVGFSPGRILRQVLESNGILDAFDSLVFSDEAGWSKPHPEVFRRSARDLQSQATEIVHIGDLEHTDVAGAKNAGWAAIRFVGVTPMGSDEPTRADRIARQLSEIPELIAGIREQTLGDGREGL